MIVACFFSNKCLASFQQFPDRTTKAGKPIRCISKSFYCVTTWFRPPTPLDPAPGNNGVWTLARWGHLVTFRLWLQPGTEDYRSKLGGDCFADLACPEKCRCEGTTVDCSNQKLTKIPDHIPQYTAELWVTHALVRSFCIGSCVILFVPDHLFPCC